ncbi:MAG: primosomal protein N' [Pirellulaceae bacterium]
MSRLIHAAFDNFALLNSVRPFVDNEQQRSLFDTAPEPWVIDDQGDWLAARVVFAEPPFGPYDYSIPPELEGAVSVGKRLTCPLGRGGRKMTGYCTHVIGPNHHLAREVNVARLKPILHVIDDTAIIDPKMIPLAEWISQYYLCPLGSVIETIVPVGVRQNAGTRELTFLSIASDVQWKPKEAKLTDLQRQVMEVLESGSESMSPKELAETVGCTQGPISTLRRKGFIVAHNRRVVQKTHEIPAEQRGQDLPLNADQSQALNEIVQAVDRKEHQTFLMFGITGSGKTEVYIRAIQKAVAHGHQAIVLVPEISLTPQTRQRFRARFDRIAVLHSHLTPSERSWHWNQIREGKVDVVIGARSAVFAPVPRLGLIVIDEEHDGSFKQDKQPRYHARDVAQWRAHAERIPLVLGSATPALESYHRATTGDWRLLNLPRRVADRPLPVVSTIDMRIDFSKGKGVSPLSLKLRQEVNQAIKDGGQVILLLNRRGFSTRVQCPKCSEVVECPDCSIPMTHHLEGMRLACHYCDFQMPTPKTCPKCGFEAFRFSGLGTQKLEQYVRAVFPDIVCERMDTDTMRKPGSHEATLARFRKGDIQLLMGTQMIAKGLDFPNVTLVGVINADSALHFPDFRASERTFALVTQVAGRSGRGPKGGRVLVQTFSPEHPAIVAATRHDYEGFARDEMVIREQAQFPPFGKISRLVVRAPHQELARDFAQMAVEKIVDAQQETGVRFRILGPAIAPVEKLRGLYRYHVLLLGDASVTMQPTLALATGRFVPTENIQWIIDIDPLDML